MEATAAPASSAVPTGWYQDVQNPGGQRYWNGEDWSEYWTPSPAEPAVGRTPASGQAVYIETAGNGLAVAALVCGIVGAVFGLLILGGPIA
jgi:hypothetical protein